MKSPVTVKDFKVHLLPYTSLLFLKTEFTYLIIFQKGPFQRIRDIEVPQYCCAMRWQIYKFIIRSSRYHYGKSIIFKSSLYLNESLVDPIVWTFWLAVDHSSLSLLSHTLPNETFVEHTTTLKSAN